MSDTTSNAILQEPAQSTPETFTAKAFAASAPTSPLGAASIARRNPLPNDVQIEILFLRRVSLRSAPGHE